MLRMYVLQSHLAAVKEHCSIMTDSAASMQSTAQLTMRQDDQDQLQNGSIAAQRMSWWRQRLKLDERMAKLLQVMDEHWLGPWRFAPHFPERAD